MAERRCHVRFVPLACLAPPNRGSFNSTHVYGTHVPVEEPSTASKADICSAANSIERSDDFIDQRLHVEVIGWRNADTPTGFFNRTGNDGPNGGYFCPQQTLSQRLFGLIR